MIETKNLYKARLQAQDLFGMNGTAIITKDGHSVDDVLSKLISYWGYEKLTPIKEKEVTRIKKRPAYKKVKTKVYNHLGGYFRGIREQSIELDKKEERYMEYYQDDFIYGAGEN